MKKKKNEINEQIDLGIKHSKLEFFYKLKRLASNIEKKYTVLPFWQNGFIWLSIISTIGFPTLIFIQIAKSYSKLPPDIPFIYNTQLDKWKSVPRITTFLLPITLFILGLVNIRYLQKVYYMNKRMTLMICFMSSILYMLEYLAINEIIVLSIR